MYQFVISKDVNLPFSLSVSLPPRSLPVSTMCNTLACNYENTLIMVSSSEGEGDLTQLQLFYDTVVSNNFIG